MTRVLLLVGTGGFLGSVSRYLIASWFTKNIPASFPYGTFIVNSVGCLLIGLVYGFSLKFESMSPAWRLFLATGFCGGFTTFSSFAYENVSLVQNQELMVMWFYVLFSLVIGFSAAFAGILITKLF